jgi:hypothetical protein
LLAVPQLLLDDSGFLGWCPSWFRRFWNRCCSCGSIGSVLFFNWSAFWNRLCGFLAFEYVFADEKGAVAGAEFGNIWVTVVARADYVPVKLEFSSRESARA